MKNVIIFIYMLLFSMPLFSQKFTKIDSVQRVVLVENRVFISGPSDNQNLANQYELLEDNSTRIVYNQDTVTGRTTVLGTLNNKFIVRGDAQRFYQVNTDGLAWLSPGLRRTWPYFTKFNNKIYFFGENLVGEELRSWNGVNYEVIKMLHINSTRQAEFLGNVANGFVFFAVMDSTPGPVGATWFSDGTEAGTRVISTQQAYSSDPQNPRRKTCGGKAYFISNLGIASSDGTSAGTQLVYRFPDITVELENFGPNKLLIAKNNLVLLDCITDTTVELTQNTSKTFQIKVDDGVAAFIALFPGGGSMWTTDGTPAGTKPFNPAQVASSYAWFKHKLYFVEPATGKLWKADDNLTTAQPVVSASLAGLTHIRNLFNNDIGIYAEAGINGDEFWAGRDIIIASPIPVNTFNPYGAFALSGITLLFGMLILNRRGSK